MLGQVPLEPDGCYLQWDPWLTDRVMGLNHQLAALSCALAEAFFLNRTLLFPSHLCLDEKHESRWHAGVAPSSSCSMLGSTGFSVPTSSLLDTAALGKLVRLRLVRLDRLASASRAGGSSGGASTRSGGSSSGSSSSSSSWASLPTSARAVEVDRAWKSERIAFEHPCSGAPLVRRRVSGFWFRPCAYGIVQCSALAAALDNAVGAGGAVSRQRSGGFIPQGMLRSGLFYSPPIRAVRYTYAYTYAIHAS